MSLTLERWLPLGSLSRSLNGDGQECCGMGLIGVCSGWSGTAIRSRGCRTDPEAQTAARRATRTVWHTRCASWRRDRCYLEVQILRADLVDYVRALVSVLVELGSQRKQDDEPREVECRLGNSCTARPSCPACVRAYESAHAPAAGRTSLAKASCYTCRGCDARLMTSGGNRVTTHLPRAP